MRSARAKKLGLFNKQFDRLMGTEIKYLFDLGLDVILNTSISTNR
jgi:hypothetical protein